uniref:Uncharacterized protein n=2 Tax=Clytia hemisphaerica TaxID=252671 RepID=A0A7M5WXE4_9CNID
MIKNHFPKRKNGSCDGVTSILPTYFQQELDFIHQQHADELSHVTKQLAEAEDREADQVDRNCTLKAEMEELTKKASGFEKVLLTQEENIQNLTRQVQEHEMKNITLNKTLTESEALNKEMTRKLQQYSDEKKRLTEEKEVLRAEKSNLNNRFLMEKSKYELLKEKQQKDEDELQQKNNSSIKDLAKLKREMGSDTSTMVTSTHPKTGANHSLVPFFLNKEEDLLRQQLKEEKEKGRRLEDELNLMRISQHHSGKKLLSSGQSLEQLETILHKKSAECSALSIKINTMQHKVTSLQEENTALQERISTYERETRNITDEIEARKRLEKNNRRLTEDIMTSKNEANRMSKINDDNERLISKLKEEIQKLKQIVSVNNSTSRQQEKQIDELTKENAKLREDYSDIHRKLMSFEYEKSDAAKVDLQRANTNLKLDITKMKRYLSNTLDHVYEDQLACKQKYDQIIGDMRYEKKDVENTAQNLRSTLKMIRLKNQHNEQLTAAKQNTCKGLLRQISDLKSRILCLEEEMIEMKQELRQKDDRIFFMENETKELHSNIDRLNSNFTFSTHRSNEISTTWKLNTYEESFYDPNKFFSINPKSFRFLGKADNS